MTVSMMRGEFAGLVAGEVYDCGDPGYRRRICYFQVDDGSGQATHTWWNYDPHPSLLPKCCRIERFARLAAKASERSTPR